MTRLDQLEAQAGRAYRHTTHDFEVAREKANANPAALTELDLAVLEYFGSSGIVEAARAAHARATQPASETIPARTAAVPPEMRDGETLEDYCARAADAPATLGIVGAILTPLIQFVKQINERNKERNARIDALETRCAALEARPVTKDAGVWRPDVLYENGDIVSHGGSAWYCRSGHCSTGTAPSHDHFRLFVKAGRDARR